MPDQAPGGVAAQTDKDGLAVQQNQRLPSRFSGSSTNIAIIRANNFVNDQQLNMFARRLASRLPNDAVRARFARVAYGFLRADPRNARLLSLDEADDLPEWAQAKLALGEKLHVFIPDPDAVEPVRKAARHLREAWLEYSYFSTAPGEVLTSHDLHMWQTCEEFFTKISRMQFEVIAAKAAHIASAREIRISTLPDNQTPFAAEEIYTAPGRSWRRLRFVEEMAKLGDELENCLAAGSKQHKGFAKRLRADTARFWVLRNHLGAALMAAMVDSVSGRILDVRGPRNAHVKRNDPDLRALMRARKLRLSPAVYLIPPFDNDG